MCNRFWSEVEDVDAARVTTSKLEGIMQGQGDGTGKTWGRILTIGLH
jgi:hypothetical protein